MKKINKTAVINFFEGPGARRIAIVVSGLLLVLIAWLLSGLFWLVVARPNEVMRAPPAETGAEQDRQISEQDIQLLSQRALFGEYRLAPPVPDTPDTPPPVRKDTSSPLVLNLLGIVSSPHNALARAIIQEQGKEDGIFAVGAQIAGRATVEQITPKTVALVLADGTRQVLTLPDDGAPLSQGGTDNASAPLPDVDQAASDKVEPPLSPPSLGGLREELVTNPERIVEYIRFAPVSRGRQFIGFRVSPGRNGDVFQQIGLRNGDIITAVDQVPMDSPQRGFEVVQKIASAQQINLTVSRGGSERNITISF